MIKKAGRGNVKVVMYHCKQACLSYTWVTQPAFLTWACAKTARFSTTSWLNRHRMINYFKPKRAVVLSKMTRYEFEKRLCDTDNEEQLKKHVIPVTVHYDML